MERTTQHEVAGGLQKRFSVTSKNVIRVARVCGNTRPRFCRPTYVFQFCTVMRIVHRASLHKQWPVEHESRRINDALCKGRDYDEYMGHVRMCSNRRGSRRAQSKICTRGVIGHRMTTTSRARARNISPCMYTGMSPIALDSRHQIAHVGCPIDPVHGHRPIRKRVRPVKPTGCLLYP